MMSYPMIGKKYYVKFPTMSFYLSFISETELQFIVERSPDLPPGSSHTVNITIQPLRDGLYLVSWQEASGNTVVDVEDFKEHRVHAFLSMKDARFIRQDAPLVVNVILGCRNFFPFVCRNWSFPQLESSIIYDRYLSKNYDTELSYLQMYWWQVGRFMREAAVKEDFVPLLYQQFAATPSTQPAFFRLNQDLPFTVRDRTKRIPQLNAFRRPVRIIFGASDPYLNVGVARRFHELFPTSDLFLVPGARHYVQIDEPEQVAQLLLSTPLADPA